MYEYRNCYCKENYKRSYVIKEKQNGKKKKKNEVQKEIISADMQKLESISVQMSQTIDLLEKKFVECIEMTVAFQCIEMDILNVLSECIEINLLH